LILLDRPQHADVREAAAQHARKPLLELRLGGLGLLIEKRLRRQDHAVQAEAALRRLFVDECLLQRMRLLRRPQPFEGRDLRAGDRADRRHARTDCAAADDDRARAALAETAAELRPAEPEIITEHVQQWRRRIDVEAMRTSIHVQCNFTHLASPARERTQYIFARMQIADRRLVAAAAVLALAAACTKNNNANTPTTPSCTVTAGTISASSFAAAGGTGSVPVTAGTGCTWTATSSATFVAITSGASGSGNGTVSFTVAANTGASRTATLTVSGTSFTVSQSAAGPTSAGSLTAPTANAPIGGQTVTDTRPTLVVNNATASGTVGTV